MSEDRPGSRLAARFRKAHADKEAQQAAQEAARARREETARAAAEELLGELAALGRDLGFVAVRVSPEGVWMEHAGREMALRHGDDAGQVVVAGSGGAHEAFLGRVYQEPALGSKWVLSFTCLLYTSPSPRDGLLSRMPSSA